MDLLMIFRKVLRHKRFTLPVIVLTLLGAAYVVAVKAPVYEAKSSFVLLNPPAPPTAEDVARDPSLGKLKTDNPYTRFGDQSVIIQVLTSTMSGEAARRALETAGADSRYVVAPTSEFGYSSPIVQVTAASETALGAIRTAKIVGDAVVRELDRMQEVQGVDKGYRINALQVVAPDHAELQASGKLRTLVGVLVLGAILLFVVISVMDALEGLARERNQSAAAAAAWTPGRLDERWLLDGDSGDATWHDVESESMSGSDIDPIRTNGDESPEPQRGRSLRPHRQ